MELVALLAKQKNCTYISAYSDREWIEAAWYVLNRRCRNSMQARRLLIG